MPAGSLPFDHLNLRRNPFGEFTPEEHSVLADVEVDRFVSCLANPRYVVQFVGEKGYGKTTRLLAIRARFPSAGYVHIPEGERGAIPAGCPLLIDEAQRLTRWQQWRLFRGSRPLVLGTHSDFTAPLVRAGRSVETVAVARETNPERVVRILNARIRWVRRHSGPVPRVRLETARRLLRECGPDLRSIHHQMYLRFQELSAVQDV